MMISWTGLMVAMTVVGGLLVAGRAEGTDQAAAREAAIRKTAADRADVERDAAARKAAADANGAEAAAAEAARKAAGVNTGQLAPIEPLAGVAFERAYFTIEAGYAPMVRAQTIEIFGDGTCRYLRVEDDKRTHLVTEYMMPAERVRRLSELLAKTEWLTAKAKDDAGRRIDDGETYAAKVMRDLGTGTWEHIVFGSEAGGAYEALRLFVVGILRQEQLYDNIGASREQAYYELASYLAGQSKPAVEIDLERFRERMLKLVRDPLDKEDWQVATAVRAVIFYKATDERKAVEALANDRSAKVRDAVAKTLGDLGGAESVAVLRKMVHRTPAAGLGLVRMGTEAVPAVVEIIAAGNDPRTDAEHVAMIRAYVDNWKKVPQPVDGRVVEAVRKSLVALEARSDAPELRYHKKFLELISERN